MSDILKCFVEVWKANVRVIDGGPHQKVSVSNEVLCVQNFWGLSDMLLCSVEDYSSTEVTPPMKFQHPMKLFVLRKSNKIYRSRYTSKLEV